MALEKEQKAAAPRGQFFQVFLFVLVIFLVLDFRLRTYLGKLVGYVLEPVLGFHHRMPILTILLASLVMVSASTLVRHFLVDWVKVARIQNTMRAFQKAMRDAQASRDPRRIEQLKKYQTKLLTLQSELSSGQMKPMAATMLIVVPLFAWLWGFVQSLDYQFFTAPWNPQVDMFTSTVLPHWILFYSAISIPFGTLLQKSLKYVSWREHWHLTKPGAAVPA